MLKKNLITTNTSVTKSTKEDNQIIKKETEQEKKNLQDIMKEENKRNREIENLLSHIKKNPDLINNWSINKLKKIEKIFAKKIAQCDIEIEELKAKMGM